MGILPDANSGALLQITPSAAVSAGVRSVPVISIQVFCAMSGPAPAVFTDVMVGNPRPAAGVTTDCWIEGDAPLV